MGELTFGGRLEPIGGVGPDWFEFMYEGLEDIDAADEVIIFGGCC